LQGALRHTQAGLLLGCLEVMIEDVAAEATGTGSLSKFCLCCMPDLPKQTRLETMDLIYTYLGNSCSSTLVMVRPHQLAEASSATRGGTGANNRIA